MGADVFTDHRARLVRLGVVVFLEKEIPEVDAFLGIRSHLDCSSTDANIPLSLGMQAVSIGAGGHGGGAHTASEWYSPDGRDAGLRRIFLSLCLLLAAE